jgi:hypothetical protein
VNSSVFSDVSPLAARAILLALALVALLAGLTARNTTLGPTPGTYHDWNLYADIAAGVAAGQSYYEVAAKAQRAHGYPTTPPVTFRQPWLAYLLSGLHSLVLAQVILFAWAAGLVLLIYARLRAAGIGLKMRLAATVAVASGVSIVGDPYIFYFHEIWASLLVTTALLLYRPERWMLPAILTLAACLFRELAIGFVVVMAAFAIRERRWKELAGWIGVTVVFAALFAWHLSIARHYHAPGDLPSPGWLFFGGIGFVVKTARWNLFLLSLPAPAVAALVCLGIVALAGSKNGRDRRAALTVGGYTAAFLFVGAPGNNYWGMLYTPFLGLGLAAAIPVSGALVLRALNRDAAPLFPTAAVSGRV